MVAAVQNNKVVKLKKKADLCLAKKVDIPSSPLWNMSMAAKFASPSDFKKIQEALDYLACKARAKLDFSEDDKTFLKELYEAFWWGGHWKGYKEAAQLANHYVNGKGKPFSINFVVYEQAKIVLATMDAMKTFILDLKAKKHNYDHIKSSNPQFVSKPYARALQKMNHITQGKLKSTGVLQAPQNNMRLHKVDGHFYLEATSVNVGNKKMKTTWSINSVYDFEPFEKQSYFTKIPLGKEKLIVQDGLSEYMSQIGVAKVFKYSAKKTEIWHYE